jgi:hypothetical protein
MRTTSIYTLIASAAVIGALAGAAASAAPAPPAPWKAIAKGGLAVSEGRIVSAGRHATLRTRSPAMRAVALDGGRHATSARLWFRYLGESTTTVPLGSGLIRRQIGLKIRAPDPCNLVYVMWHAFPDDAIEIQVKRNPGQTTSSQCGNNGYTQVATIPLGSGDGTGDHSAHRLDVRTRRAANGALALTVHTDGNLLRKVNLSASLTAGLAGPIGVRSDNGDYLFQLSGRR